MSATALMSNPEKDYDLKKVLGKGSFGEVYFAIQRSNGQEVALKKLKVETQKSMDSVLREIEIMKNVDNPHIVSYYHNYYYNKEIWISMEYCSMGSLSHVLDKLAKQRPPRGFREEYQIASVALGVLGGLVFMHRRNVVHRDIKSDNILLNREGLVKIADFGISRQLANNEQMKTMIGTPHYLAPEVVTADGEEGYTAKVDVWALGIIVLEMADGRPPWCELQPMKVLFELANNPEVRLKRPEKWSNMMVNFLEFCTKPDPAERPSSENMLKHPWLIGHEPYLDLTGTRRPQIRPTDGQDFERFRQEMGQLNLSSSGGGGGGAGGGADHPSIPNDDKAKRKLAIQYFNKGIALDSKGEHDQAIEMYTTALSIDPTHVGSYTNRGVSYINKKDFDRAIENFRKACDLNPSDANGFVNVGVAYANKKDYRSALDAFATALRINPTHKVALSMQRRCEQDMRKLQGESATSPRAAASPRVSHVSPRVANDDDAVHVPPQPEASNKEEFWKQRQHFDRAKKDVPVAVALCVRFLQSEDELVNVNVFQEPGDEVTVARAKEAFDSGNDRVDVSRIGPHNVAALLWRWFHTLYEPLLTYELYTHFLEASDIVAASSSQPGAPHDVTALQTVIKELPPGNLATFQCLMEYLMLLHKMQGTAVRLSRLFGPVLLRPPPNHTPLYDRRVVSVVFQVIVHYEELFGSSRSGMNSAPSNAVQRLNQKVRRASVQLDQSVSKEQKMYQDLQQSESRSPNPFGHTEPGIVFQNVSREAAEDILNISKPGAYLIRPSSQPGCLSCSYKSTENSRIGHLLLQKPSASSPGWTTDGRPRPFATIRALLQSLPYGLQLD